MLNVPNWYLKQTPVETVNFLKNSYFIDSRYEADEEMNEYRFIKYLEDKIKRTNYEHDLDLDDFAKAVIRWECLSVIPGLRNDKNLDKKLPISKGILDEHFANFAKTVLAYYFSPSYFRGYRYEIIKNDPKKNLTWADTLFIFRYFASDHLPVVIRFN